MKEVTVKISYPGSCISVNHYLGRTKDGREYVRSEALDWQITLGWMVKTAHIEDWKLPLKITISGIFKNLRSCPDIHNLVKVTCDAIEEVTGLNDRNFKTETKEPQIDGSKEPEIIITIQESADD